MQGLSQYFVYGIWLCACVRYYNHTQSAPCDPVLLVGNVIMVYVVNRLPLYMALLCRVVAAPSSSCVEAARWFLAIRWFLGIEEPLNETETERELQTEQRREHLQSRAGLPQLGGEDNGQGWNRKGGGVCSVHLLDSGVTNICLCGLPLTRGGMGIWLCWYRWLAKSVGVVG